MTKDYASRRVSKSKRVFTPARLFGILIIAVLAIGLLIRLSSNSQMSVVNLPKIPVAKQAPVDVPLVAQKPRFDFYDLLPAIQVKVDNGAATPQPEVKPQHAATLTTVNKTRREAKLKSVTKPKPVTIAEQVVPAKPVQLRDYFLQVASFVRVTDAERLRARLILLGFSAKVDQFQGTRTLFYRVMLGPFSRMEIAQQTQKRLASAHYKSILLTVKHQTVVQ